MEFDFDITAIFPDQITRTVGGRLPSRSQGRCSNHDNNLHFTQVVNEMGVASAKAQRLLSPITSFQKLQSSDQVLYVMRDDSKGQSSKSSVVGILKTGHKKLFLNDSKGLLHEVEPICVLDFYVHESKQRSGCGKVLFESMLKSEGVKPYEVAIDRPSSKFLGFLRKHYQLHSYGKQANNYVVFEQFFTTCKDLRPRPRRYSFPLTTQNLPTFLTFKKTSLGQVKRLPTFSSGPQAHLSPLPSSQSQSSNHYPLITACKPDMETANIFTAPDVCKASTASTSTNKQLLNSNRSPIQDKKSYNIITGLSVMRSYSNRNEPAVNLSRQWSYTCDREYPAVGLKRGLQVTSPKPHTRAPNLNMRKCNKECGHKGQVAPLCSSSIPGLSETVCSQGLRDVSTVKYSRHREAESKPIDGKSKTDTKRNRIETHQWQIQDRYKEKQN